MESTFLNITVMGLDSGKIRQEIRKNLRNGRIRSKTLADEVIKKIGSEKTVYKEIRNMVESGEIQKIEHNRADIEYEFISLSELIKRTHELFSNQLNEINQSLKKFQGRFENEKMRPSYIEHLMTIVQDMRRLLNCEARLRIHATIPAFKKSDSYSKIKEQIEEIWEILIPLIDRNPEEKFVKELLYNFRFVSIRELKPINKN
jgi:predicted transcriptional regulator